MVQGNIVSCGKKVIPETMQLDLQSNTVLGGEDTIPKTIQSGLPKDMVLSSKFRYLYRELEVQLEERKYRTSNQPYKVVGW